MDPIHVLGVGVRSPFGAGPTALLDGLCGARPAFRRWEPFATAGVKHPVAGQVPDDALDAPGSQLWWDRGTRLLWSCVSDAIADTGGMGALGCAGERIGLVVGTSAGGIGPLTEALRERAHAPHANAHYAASAGIVARTLGLQGPVLVVGAVCASGALAIAEAASWLDDGVVDAVIAAGFDPLEPFVAMGFDTLGALAAVPSPFRAGRRGLVLAESSAALVLARRVGSGPTRGLLLGWGTSTDAHHLTAPHPEGEGVVLAIERALARAGIDRTRVGAINAHGTGTVYNDAMEAAAFRRVFGPRAGGRPVYTVKGTIGHTLAASGALEAVVSLAALDRRCVPPTCGEGELDPGCDLDVSGAVRRDDRPVTLSVSAGFGGINAALLLARERVGGEAPPIVARRRVVIRGEAVWCSGRWVTSADDLGVIEALQPGPLELGELASNRRIQRADRATRLAASVVARALEGLPDMPDVRRVSIVSASAWASAHSNEQWELARQEARRPDPRVFAYTATNAAAGEIAAAVGARGPSVAVIGTGTAGLAALARGARWIEEGHADRVIAVAVECPPQHARCVRPELEVAPECAAAIVLEAAEQGAAELSFRWSAEQGAQGSPSPLLSVEPIARIALAARVGESLRVTGDSDAGATLTAMLR